MYSRGVALVIQQNMYIKLVAYTPYIHLHNIYCIKGHTIWHQGSINIAIHACGTHAIHTCLK